MFMLMIYTCKSDTQIKQALCKKFDVKDLGELHHFLGMKIAQDEDVWIGQPAYIDKVIEKYGMQDAKCVSTPVDASSKLVKSVESDVCFDPSVVLIQVFTNRQLEVCCTCLRVQDLILLLR